MSEPHRDATSQRRISIAQDALDRILAGRTRLAKGFYRSRDLNIDSMLHVLGTASCQGVIDEVESSCQVCLRGAMLLSKIRLYNDVSGHDYNKANIGEDNRALLLQDFDDRTIDLMESAFEAGVFFPKPENKRECERIIALMPNLSPVDRAVLVLRNYIECGGIIDLDKLERGLRPRPDREAHPLPQVFT